MLPEDWKKLSTDEKIVLMHELWDSIGEDDNIKLNKKQKKLLRDRERAAMSPNAKFLTWEEIKQSIRKQHAAEEKKRK